MNFTFEQILSDIQNKIFYPVYLLCGDEPFFIDQISRLIEKSVLSEDEKVFNQTIIYGRDVNTADLIAIARQYPMFANYRVIIVREAQEIRDIEKDPHIEAYLSQPVPTTLLVFDYKYKKPDGRTNFTKLIIQKGVYFESRKLYDSEIPEWIRKKIASLGYRINENAVAILAENIGNDLARIENEIHKLILNVPNNAVITPDIVEQNIGISKEYNIFELQKALGVRNIPAVYRIVHHLAANPKENPVILVIITLFNFFKKVMTYHYLKDKSQKNVASQLMIHPYFVRDYATAASNYPPRKLREIISILREYDQKAKGVDTASIPDGELLKEMIFRILH